MKQVPPVALRLDQKCNVTPAIPPRVRSCRPINAGTNHSMSVKRKHYMKEILGGSLQSFSVVIQSSCGWVSFTWIIIIKRTALDVLFPDLMSSCIINSCKLHSRQTSCLYPDGNKCDWVVKTYNLFITESREIYSNSCGAVNLLICFDSVAWSLWWIEKLHRSLFFFF